MNLRSYIDGLLYKEDSQQTRRGFALALGCLPVVASLRLTWYHFKNLHMLPPFLSDRILLLPQETATTPGIQFSYP